MAKKQLYGNEALALKHSQRKMAKVIISKKNPSGSVSFHEHIMDQEKVRDFLAKPNN
jgi:hypothetical protein